jgi:GT2 family glycosyltransferase
MSGTAAPPPLVSIVIPAFNKWSYTYKCLLSLVHHTRGVPHETIVVDNASSDETAEALPHLEGLRFIRNEQNLGFARACNQGAAAARGRYLVFLNNDTEALPGWLEPMVRLVESEPTITVVGSKLLFPDGTLQHAGVAVAYADPLPISPFHYQYRQPPAVSDKILELSVVTGACLLIRADAFRELGGFDEAFVNGYEDVDLCLRVRERGGRVFYTPQSVLFHHESVSDGRFRHTTHNEILLNKRWMGRFTAFDFDRRRRPRQPPAPGRPPLSVVVPCHDALGSVAACLEDLAVNLGDRDELVVVDAGSTDGSREFIELFAREHPQVRVVDLPRAEGLAGATAHALGAGTRPFAFVSPTTARYDERILDGVASALVTRGRHDAIACRVPRRGFALAAPAPVLAAVRPELAAALAVDDVAGLTEASKRSRLTVRVCDESPEAGSGGAAAAAKPA